MREDEKKFLEMLNDDNINEKKAASIISNMINAFVINTFDIFCEIEHDEKLKKNMDALSRAWILSEAECYCLRDNYDGRNVIACKLCQDYKEANKIDEENGIWAKVANRFTREHRTLQQSFTRFVFKYLEFSDPDFYDKIKSAGYDGIPSLPLI